MSADDKEQEEATREKKPKMSKKKKGAIVAGIFLVLIVIIAGVVYYMGHRYYTKTNYMTDDEVQALTTITSACDSSSVTSNPWLTSAPSISSESTRFLSHPRDMKNIYID